MWPRIVNIALGLWLMAAPDVLSLDEFARTNDVIVGPLLVSLATVAIWEATRPLRWVNLVLGLWLLAAPWILGYASAAAIVNDLLVGVLVTGLSLTGGKTRQRFDGGWACLWRGNCEAAEGT